MHAFVKKSSPTQTTFCYIPDTKDFQKLRFQNISDWKVYKKTIEDNNSQAWQVFHTMWIKSF